MSSPSIELSMDLLEDTPSPKTPKHDSNKTIMTPPRDKDNNRIEAQEVSHPHLTFQSNTHHHTAIENPLPFLEDTVQPSFPSDRSSLEYPSTNLFDLDECNENRNQIFYRSSSMKSINSGAGSYVDINEGKADKEEDCDDSEFCSKMVTEEEMTNIIDDSCDIIAYLECYRNELRMMSVENAITMDSLVMSGATM